MPYSLEPCLNERPVNQKGAITMHCKLEPDRRRIRDVDIHVTGAGNRNALPSRRRRRGRSSLNWSSRNGSTCRNRKSGAALSARTACSVSREFCTSRQSHRNGLSVWPRRNKTLISLVPFFGSSPYHYGWGTQASRNATRLCTTFCNPNKPAPRSVT